jgi:hypothetical protein
VRALGALGIDEFALTGGVALGFWTEPRATRDIDLVAELPERALLPLLAQFHGMRFGTQLTRSIVEPSRGVI